MSRDRIRREANAAWRLDPQDLRSKSTVKELRVHMELERKRSAVRSGFSHVRTPEDRDVGDLEATSTLFAE